MVYNFCRVKQGIAVAFATGVGCEIHDIKVELFSREFKSERLRREARFVAGRDDPSKGGGWRLSVDYVGALKLDKRKSGRSSGWTMKSLTFSTFSSVKTALRPSLAVRFFPKIKVILGLSIIFGTIWVIVIHSLNC